MARIKLRDVSYLRFLDLPTVERLRPITRSRTFEPEEVIHSQGAPRNALHLIRRGSVKVLVGGGQIGARPLVRMSRGDVLGEGMIVSDATHSNTAIAESRVVAWEIQREDFERVVREDQTLYVKLLRAANELLLSKLQTASRGAEVAQLTSGDTRMEHDLLGDKEVPADVYWGVHTARAVENFRITRTPISHYTDLIIALAWVKHAAANANHDCGRLDEKKRSAITAACEEIISGKFHSHFVVDVVQGGAGTSTNMNANEVIANRALELMGRGRGDYSACHPNNDVNCSQSTNDTYPTALKLGIRRANRRLLRELNDLVDAFRAKAKEYDRVVKMGRTQLQDAVPMTLGQEFAAWALSIQNEIDTLEAGERNLAVVNMGGTAIGTKLNAPEGFSERAIEHLRTVADWSDLELAEDLIESTQDTQAFVLFSGLLKSVAVKLQKIASDLRLLSSGPRAGFGDIKLPPRQAGSSIMPGKVNPVIPEVVNQVCFRVIANDLCVTLAAAGGQLQLNAFEPIMAAAILESTTILLRASATLRANCITDIQANEQALRETVERSIGLATALVPALGYEVTTRVAQDAELTGKGVVELVRERGLLSEERIAELLSPDRMT